MTDSYTHNPDFETIPVTVTAEFALKTPTVEGEILELTPKGVTLRLPDMSAGMGVDPIMEKAKLISKPVNLKIPGFGFFEGVVISIEDNVATIFFTENHKVMVNLILDKYNVSPAASNSPSTHQ